MSAAKERLDVLLVQRGFETTREKAKAAVLRGLVYVDGVMIDKPGTLIKTESDIKTKEASCPYVGRGGLKLEKALKVFKVEVSGKIFIDVGASTGGFTDCLLKNGALKVFAVDVGYGQIAWELRCDPRVVVKERLNIRHATPEMFDSAIDGAVIDVSFISLKLVLPVIRKLLPSDGDIIALLKPQFEAGKKQVNKNGVVTNPSAHVEVLAGIKDFCLLNALCVENLTFSPIKNPNGNIEYLLHIKKNAGENCHLTDAEIELTVTQAFAGL